MSDQPLDLRRSMQAIRRHWIAVTLATIIGAGAGAGYTVLKPPMLSSNALVVVTTATSAAMGTQVVIADSNTILSSALPHVSPPMSLLTLRSRVKVASLSDGVISVTASGKTAAQAEVTANAVADSYVAYVTAYSKAMKLSASVEDAASDATGRSVLSAFILTGVIGGLIGLLIGVIIALALAGSDRRLRQRDQIADAIGVPVLASLPVAHPTDAAQWSRLLDEYQPGVTQAWRLRNALQYLGLFDGRYPQARHHGRQSVTIVSLSSDQRALALGPQVAVFAASLGVPTVLAIDRQQDASVTAALRVACSGPVPPTRSSNLRVVVADHDDSDWQAGSTLTVVVCVVDGRNPDLTDAIPTAATVLGVTAGAATAEQLARVATSLATHGRSIDGILVADPDSDDPTTGRIPQLARPTRTLQPTRLTGITTETRR
jgi:capsular polysaccharide biosynthesis protein